MTAPFKLYRPAGLLASGAVLLCSMLQTQSGQAETAGDGGAPSSSDAMAKEDTESSANDLTRPVNDFEARLENRQSLAPGSETQREYAILRATTRIDLDQWWKFSLYAQTEGENKRTEKSSGSADDAGLGDSVVQAVLIRKFDEQWAAGAGARIVAPTASDEVGSGKWQVMPGFGVRYSFLERGDDSFFVPQMRYAVSVAGTHWTRDISELQIAPLLNLDLPGKWFLTLYPSYDVRINFGPPVPGQTGQLFFPADAAIGYRLSDHIVISLEGSVPIVKDYPVYDFKTELRVIFKY